MASNPERRPVLFAYRSSVSAIITTVSFAVFTDIFLYGVINPVAPFALQSRIGIAEEKVQYWVSILLTAYGATLFVMSPLWGFFADRITNRKFPMVAGLALLGGATALLMAGTNIPMVLIARLLQGAAAALNWTVGLALVFDTVQGPNIGRALGWVSMAISAALLSSPMLGGIVYQYGGYYPVYAMCFGLIAVDIAMPLLIIEAKAARRWNEPESSTLVNAAVAPSLGEEKVADPSVSVPPPVDETNASPSSPQSKPKKPGMISLLRKTRLLAALGGNFVLGIIDTSFNSTLPLFVADTFNWNSTGAGLIFLPLQVPSLLGPLVGAGSDRWGPKPLVVGGFLLSVPFLVCLQFVTDNTLAHKAMLCGLLTGVGIGRALIVGPLMAEITWVVEEQTTGEEAGGTEPSTGGKTTIALAYGLYNMAFSGGSILGPVMAGNIRDASDWGTVGWSLGILAFVTFVTQAIWIGAPLTRRV
ncbi:MFS general substrate transporter [Periconia macrospinosa]|uniref:MFS general substrate transporter n=1 Tax=Periconia macrospinosa TaxID=97972 RepID=A0A2V1DS33_9PLEO|nr:MFS general substrate transporter [Periconia macrospinosa]